MFRPAIIADCAARLADTAFDRTVIPGYSRLGYAARSRFWPPGDPAGKALDGAVVAITGAGSGLGKAAAGQLAGYGAEVLMLVRDTAKGAAAREDLLREHPQSRIRIEQCDLSDLDDVRAAAGRLRARLPQLDVLIHNAGVMPSSRGESPQGHETALATHVLGPTLLTDELLPLLTESIRPRVVLVSSGGMYAQRLHADDPEYRHGEYRGATAYGRTKRMQVALLPVLAARWERSNTLVAAMHPGWAATPGLSGALPGFHAAARALLRSPAQGADTVSWLAATYQALPTARFWHDRRPRPEHYLPRTRYSSADLRTLQGFVDRALRP